jgi:multicomponent K+:H+ antiporter subunit A
MLLPVETLVLLCVLVGVAPALIVGPVLAIAARSVLGTELPRYELALWHGVNLPLLMSAIAFGGGALLFLYRRRLYAFDRRFVPALTAERVYGALVNGVTGASAAITRRLETGSLQRYVLFLVAFALAAGAAPLLDHPFRAGAAERTPLDAVNVTGAFILTTAAIATAVVHRRRLAALIMISVVGLLVAITFVRLAAPDLALTQLLVEMVTILLVLLALDYLPRQTPYESKPTRRARDVLLAGAAGVGVAALAWGVLTRAPDTISHYFVEQSKPAGGGTNIVNVILVDFRGFDTLGEIAVLGIAALGVLVMLAGVDLATVRRMTPRARDRSPVILTTITRALVPFALLFSLFLLLRGHNLPGGGFIAGLMTAIALILQYVASGSEWTETRLRGRYRAVIALGLLIAFATGFGALVVGYPFLSSTFTYVDVPLIGEVELATAMIFDVGVFLTVVGAVMLMLSRLGVPLPHDEEDAEFAREVTPWKP